MCRAAVEQSQQEFKHSTTKHNHPLLLTITIHPLQAFNIIFHSPYRLSSYEKSQDFGLYLIAFHRLRASHYHYFLLISSGRPANPVTLIPQDQRSPRLLQLLLPLPLHLHATHQSLYRSPPQPLPASVISLTTTTTILPLMALYHLLVYHHPRPPFPNQTEGTPPQTVPLLLRLSSSSVQTPLPSNSKKGIPLA